MRAKLLLRFAHFEAGDLPAQCVAVNSQKLGRLGKLPIEALERLAKDGPVRLIFEDLIQVRDFSAGELVEESAEALVEELLQWKFERVHAVLGLLAKSC